MARDSGRSAGALSRLRVGRAPAATGRQRMGGTARLGSPAAKGGRSWSDYRPHGQRTRAGSLLTTTRATSISSSSMNAAKPSGPKASGIGVLPSAKVLI